jgi:hypothetical protein
MADLLEDMRGGAVTVSPAPPEVVVEVCRCGCTPQEDGRAAHPDWALATAWAFLTRPVEPAVEREDADAGAGAAADPDEPDPASLPWWDARSRPARRRAVLPLVLLGELQAGVLLRAVWEVVQRPGGPAA